MGSHLDVVAEHISFITHDGLDANSVTIIIFRFARHEVRMHISISGFFGSPTLWIGSVASAQGRVRGQRWKSHSSALEK